MDNKRTLIKPRAVITFFIAVFIPVRFGLYKYVYVHISTYTARVCTCIYIHMHVCIYMYVHMLI